MDASVPRFCLGAGAAFGFVLPVCVLLWWRRKRHGKLLPCLVGALTWFVFAAVLEPLLHRACLLPDHALSRALNANPYLYMLYGGLAAGVFEETGRYVAFRWLLRANRFPGRDTAVTYGIGHGGVESMLTLGLGYAALYLTSAAGENPALLADAVGAITPAVVMAAMLERVSAMILHIALSCFVFLAVRGKGQWTWFPFAILLHAMADMPAVLYQRGVLPLWPVELWMLVVALFSLYSARKQYLEEMDL